MGGSFFGGAAALGYFLIFQLCGVLLCACFFKRERRAVQVLLGSAAGSVLLMWLPALFAFFLGFTMAAHLSALILLLLLTALAVWKRRPPQRFSGGDAVRFLRRSPWLLVPLALLLVFSVLVLHSFRFENGAVYSGQCTYGDMTMHLGFITSIAEQGTFPPDYSILPGTKLSYPFLSDSISSSLYLFGAPLQFAYMLPMLFAGAQVFFGAWLLLGRLLRDGAKRLLAYVLFFLNGGFGIVYFLTNLGENPGNFTRIFTAFYETPTNLVDNNIRWVNVIVDMMLPQRASLFGWAILFPLLYVLYRAVYEKQTAYFPAAGIFAGAMVMIHTHSFLALALISGVWLVFSLCRLLEKNALFAAKCTAGVLLFLCFVTQFFVPKLLPRESTVFLVLVLAAAAGFLVLFFALLMAAVRRGHGKMLMRGWGVFLLLTLLLAVPQLITWTFTQVNAQSFLRGWYNWGNLTDGYLWFYLVNLGVFGLFLLPALFSAGKRSFTLAAPAVLMWFICEFVVFQPNTYDNNKLLYVAYLLLTAPVASYMVDVYRSMKAVPARRVLAGVTLFFCTAGAVLTIGRESVSSYELYGESQMKAAAFIEENSAPDDTVLTDMRHNNAIAALTGRSIVCGSPTYVFFHGLKYTERENEVKRMFAAPAENLDLFEKYSVDYVMLSSYERANFELDEAAFAQLFELCYSAGDVQIYEVAARP